MYYPDRLSCPTATFPSALKRVLHAKRHLRYLTKETHFCIDDQPSAREIYQWIDIHPQKNTCRDRILEIRLRPYTRVSHGDVRVVVDSTAIKLKSAKAPRSQPHANVDIFP